MQMGEATEGGDIDLVYLVMGDQVIQVPLGTEVMWAPASLVAGKTPTIDQVREWADTPGCGVSFSDLEDVLSDRDD